MLENTSNGLEEEGMGGRTHFFHTIHSDKDREIRKYTYCLFGVNVLESIQNMSGCVIAWAHSAQWMSRWQIAT